MSGRVIVNIASDGTLTGLQLVPNDAITPGGTYYNVTISTTSPVRASWTEKWSLTTSPDPVDIGDITRLSLPPGVSFALDSFSDVLLAAPASGQILEYDGAGQWRNVAGSLECRDPRVFCVGKQPGAEYEVPSGMTAGTGGSANRCGIPTDLAATTSALYAAMSLAGDGTGSPVKLILGPGNWNTCLHIDPTGVLDPNGAAVSTLRNLTLEIQPGAVIHPRGGSGTQVNGGVVRVCATAAPRDSCDGITIINNGEVINPTFDSPEGAFYAGKEGGPGSNKAAPWDNITIRGTGRWVAAHDVIQATGSNLATDPDLPTLIVDGAHMWGMADIFATKQRVEFKLLNSYGRYDSNLFEAASSQYLAQQTGTLQAGDHYATTNTSTFTLAAGQGGGDDVFNGRKITLSGGSCGATGRAIGSYWITDYNSTTKVATVSLPPQTLNAKAALGGTSTTLISDSLNELTEFGRHYVVDAWITIGAGTCSGEVRQITNFDNNTGTFTVSSPWSCPAPDATSRFGLSWGKEDPTAGCSYTIAHVTHNDGTPYTYPAGTCASGVCTVGRVGAKCSVSSDCNGDIIDTPYVADGVSGILDASTFREFWKAIGAHLGINSTAGYSTGVLQNYHFEAFIDDWGGSVDAECNGQAMVAGFLQYANWSKDILVKDTTFDFYINTEPRRNVICPYMVAGVMLSGGTVEGTPTFDNVKVRFFNRGAPSLDQAALVSVNQTDPDPILVDTVSADWTTTVGGYIGREYLAATVGAQPFSAPAVGTMKIGRAISPDILYLNERPGSISWVNGQASLASFGDKYPIVTNAGTAWTAGRLDCTKGRVDNGTALLSNVSLRVTTGVAAKTANVCTYSADGSRLLLKAEGIDVSSSGAKTASLSTAGTLPPGDYWLCVGSDATATMAMGGRTAPAPSLGIAGRLTTGAATCPATIAPGSMVAITDIIAEAVLMP